MTSPRVIVGPPDAAAGRNVRIGDQFVGRAFALRDLVAFMQEAGLHDWDELDVVRSDLIEWRGGGPEVWGVGGSGSEPG
ncbi:hypothetical protein ABTZ78_17160 [Streptomyces bauhiniae]|uniref:hypothetical protein n=1 Tax=Streptomyces bauhiniae TaxID=2340725 RepID=UPI00331A4975